MFLNRLFRFLDGKKAVAGEVNAEFDQIISLLNGNIEGDNIKVGSIPKNRLKEILSDFWQDPVNTYTELPILTAKPYETRIVRDEEAVYMFVPSTTTWQKLQGVASPRMHAEMAGRDVANAHPVSAITGLLDELKLAAGQINVKQHGVKGDGVTDDTAAITAVIAAAKSGETLYFPSGTYLISSVLINKFLHVKGAGKATMFKRINNAAAGDILKYDLGTTVYNMEMKDFRIIGNKQNNANAGIGLHIKDGTNVKITNVFINDTKGTGFYFEKMSNSHLVDCMAHACDGHSIFLDAASEDCHVFGGDFGSSLYGNIQMEGPSSSVRDAIAWGAREGANIVIAATAPSVQIIGATAEGALRGHNIIVRSNFNLITGCKIYDASDDTTYNKNYDGIFFDPSGVPVGGTLRGTAILNNIFYGHLYSATTGNHRHHINLNGAQYIDIFGNSMRWNGNGQNITDPNLGWVVVNDINNTTNTDYSWTKSFVNAGVSAEIALTAGTWTDLTFTENSDLENEFDGKTFVPKYSGVYNLDISVMLKGTNAGLKMLRILRNGAEQRLDIHQHPTAGQWDSVQGSTSVYLFKGDTVVFQAYSSTVDGTYSGNGYTRMSIKLQR